ncbi:MAG TPA: hypothetical protein VE944_28935 [Nostoc sp.]|uniref:hypothetical protein n=1 Tax=Nostoc sp. TaxID=1180 RepID=UPI002D6E52C7|nr:hypothetical protein [Nostoc sp.]HYX18320.1 hypothetical protein [Nostoc sp.]
METAEKMPRTKAESKVRIDVYLPKPLVEEIERVAKADGWTEAELYRMLVLDGLSVYSEKSNKRLINEQMRKKRKVQEEETDDDNSD